MLRNASTAPQKRLAGSSPNGQALGGLPPYRNPLHAGTKMFRMKGVASHLIFYRPIKNGVEIVRVVHGARDIESLFRR